MLLLGDDGKCSSISSVDISRDGNLFVSCSGADGTVKIWKTGTDDCICVFRHEGRLYCNAWLSDDESIVFFRGRRRNLKIVSIAWNLDTTSTLSIVDESKHRRKEAGFQLEIKDGNIIAPIANVCGVDHHYARKLTIPGPYDKAYGLLTNDRVLAFAANGEAHWYCLRRRDA